MKEYRYRVFSKYRTKFRQHLVIPLTEKSVWMMDSDGKNQKLLAGWKYSDPNDDRSTDFYGRIDWNVMFAIFLEARAA